jgi:hypothetical protein
MLPPSMFGGDGGDKDPFDENSDEAWILRDVVQDYIDSHGMPESASAREWLENPNYHDVIEAWRIGSGFSTDEWLEGMNIPTDIRIRDTYDGGIEIEFDVDFEIGDYDLGGRTPYASF